jgi:hypothetical protein
MINLAVWVKTNAGQGSFYRSQHELIAVFRVGEGPHLNCIELGRHGRSRSNVWQYVGANSFRAGRLEDLNWRTVGAHPPRAEVYNRAAGRQVGFLATFWQRQARA